MTDRPDQESGHETLEEVRRWRREAFQEWSKLSEAERRRLEEEVATRYGLSTARAEAGERDQRQAS